MRWGRDVPEGFLPVYSVESVEKAEKLIASACKMNPDGDYVADELIPEQTIERLNEFSKRLDDHYQRLFGDGS